MPALQQKNWQKALQRVQKIIDGLGMPVDKKIVETVAIMQLMGIYTTMSCEGHIGRTTGGPYVIFHSPLAEKYRLKCAAIGDPKNPQYKTFYKKAMQANLKEQQKIYPFLEKFYESRDVPYGQRLTLHTMGFSACKLHCQNADLAYISSTELQKQVLQNNQNEVHAFTEYLKGRYFKM